jgi:hypothetical protein
MKANFVYGLAGMLLALVLPGCNLFFPEEETKEALRILPPSGAAPIPDNFWGEWIDLKTGERRYIDDSNDNNLTRLSDNVITDGNGAFLYPSRIANAGFSGKIAILSGQNRSVRAVGGGLGGIQGTVTNLKNAADEHSFTTDENGEYEVEGVIPGDTYKVEVEDEEIEFTPSGDGDNAGTITLIDDGGTNFKVSFTQDNSYLVYAHSKNESGYPVHVPIVITNTGDIDATAATYQLTLENGLSSSESMTGILGTIEPGRTKEIRISVDCSSESMNSDYAFKTIGVQIDDPIHHKTWHDSVSVKFYRKEFDFLIIPGNRELFGIFVTPSGAYRFGNNYNDGFWYDDTGREVHGTFMEFHRPLLTGDYTLVFCGATADTETVYSFGIEQRIDVLYDMRHNFTDVARYEPNDTEQTAAVITSDKLVAYLHKGDFDYYRFRLAYY